jgi:hypothetical protein
MSAQNLIYTSFSKVGFLTSKQRADHIQNALDWLSNKKEEHIYFINEISINEYLLIDQDYVCSNIFTNNSDIIRWLQQYAKDLEPLRSMIMCIIDSNDHPFPTLHFEIKKKLAYFKYSQYGRQNAKEDVLYMIENMMIRLSFLLKNDSGLFTD